MAAFYNENCPLAAATIREAIARNLIAPGVVDERDIRDICPDELSGFTQVHLFAGGGIWSYSLRRAGWPDDRPVWTCSCPCQPFSEAGKGCGFDDERNLWPSAYWLISQCEPECIFGEQVSGKNADPWLDLVQADMEAMDHAFGCVPLTSAGFGAPNLRHRSFWVAYAARIGRKGFGGHREIGTAEYRGSERPADTGCRPDERWSGSGQAFRPLGQTARQAQERQWGWTADSDSCATSGVADTLRARWAERGSGAGNGSSAGRSSDSDGNPGPVNGFWRDADWLYCRDPGSPRWRPVDAGTFPLAPGHPGRVGGLRISGNAINAIAAAAFIEAVMFALAPDALASPGSAQRIPSARDGAGVLSFVHDAVQ